MPPVDAPDAARPTDADAARPTDAGAAYPTDADVTDPDGVAAAKQLLRRAVLADRRRRDPVVAAAADRALTDLLPAAPELAALGPGSTVAGYLPLPGEPSPLGVLAALSRAGVAVLLPVLLADGDLDWAPAGPPGSPPDTWALTAARAGTVRPTGPTAGPDAIARVDAVLVPGVAGDAAGRRLGRGGGSYDRALARSDVAGAATESGGVAGNRPWTCLLLWPGELVPEVPAALHDQRVDAVATAGGIVRFDRRDGATGR